MPAGSGGPLHGLGVLVTRPAHQAEGLAGLIEAAGGRAFVFPLLEIGSLEAGSRAPPWIHDLPRCDFAVFVSANAVDHGLAMIEAHGGSIASMAVIAVGRATARRLEAHGIRGVSVPAVASSEGLLRLDMLKAERIAGKRLLIVRGAGGRELLAEGLRGRGALVDYAEVYQRRAAETDPKPLLALWDRGEIGAVVVTSTATLERLACLGGAAARERMLDVTLVVLSDRLAARARELGFRRPPLVAIDADDAGLVSALSAWRIKREPAGSPVEEQ